jgi:hypothetical protein
METATPVVRAGTRRRIARVVLPMVVAVLTMLGFGTAAYADGSWSTYAYSGCSHEWTSNQYGGFAVAHESYTATTSNSKHAIINTAHSWVDTLEDCGPAGHGLTAYSIDVETSFRFRGTSLNCSIGYPLSFSCTVSGSDAVFSYTAHCSTNVSSCSHSFGTLNFYAQSGQYFSNVVWMQTTITLNGPSGDGYTWSTEAV